MSLPPPHRSLQRSEARQRAEVVAVSQMAVELDLTKGDTTFDSRSTLTFAAHAGETFVDFQGAALRSATLNGRRLDADSWRDGRIPLPDLQPLNELVVDGEMAYSNDGEGMYRHVDPADSAAYLYAMSFLNAAPRWFACFDQPDLKSPYEFDVTAPPGWTVIGNGPSRTVAPGRWRLSVAQPLPTYITTLVAGPYASVTDEHDGIPLGLHVRASLKDALHAEAPDLLAVTKASFDYYHRVFGVRYPFDEYHQAFVPDFNAGAMENAGCVTLRDTLVYRARATTSERAGRATTVAHEMAHMWFGDLVTLQWWDDLWLNESFAEYLAHRVSDEATGYPSWTEFGIRRKDWGSVVDQSSATHPVAGNGAADADEGRQNVDGISYAKGAAVLKQLVSYLGEDVFWSGLRRYFAAHAFGNATFADLMSAWKAAGARNLDEWADSWLLTSGMDTIDVTRGQRAALIAVTPPDGQRVSRSHAIQVGVVDAGGRLVAATRVVAGSRPVSVDLPDGVALVVPDAGDDTWARIRFGPEGWAELAAVLGGITVPAVRVVAYNSVRDAVRSAELSPGRALDLLCDAALSEPSDVVVTCVLGFALAQLAGPYAPPEDRANRRHRVFTTASAVLDGSPPASDRQLAAFRIAIASCADVPSLRSWLAGVALPVGVELDRELSWLLVERICGATGDEALLEQALREDPTAAARTHAARARALLPTPAAKETAWRLLMEPSDRSAAELYATAEGFFDPAQAQLTQPYVPRYFAEVAQTASFRTGWALGRVAELAYPSSASTPQTLDLAASALARDDLTPDIRRSLADGTDRLRRAVTARSLVVIES